MIFFIGVTDTKGGTSKITDNHGSVFKYVKKPIVHSGRLATLTTLI